MTPLMGWIKRTTEKWFGKYYEGPEPPERFHQLVVAFANAHKHATRADWIAFATAHAGEAYRSGYIRGLEYIERDEEGGNRAISPDVIADAMDPDWRWATEPIKLQHDPNEPVPIAYPEIELARDELDATVAIRR